MLTTSILFLVLALLSGWFGISTYLGYTSFCAKASIYESPVVQVLVNPGFAWIVAAGIVLILAAVLLVCTLRTKKPERIGKKLPLFVAEISTLLLGAAMAISAIYDNFNFGYYVSIMQTNDYEMSILPIVVGTLLALGGLALLVIQILKGVSHDFSVKMESTRIYGFFRDYKSEMKKIVWSSKKDVLHNTIVVVVTLTIVGVLVALIDLGFTQLLLLIGA